MEEHIHRKIYTWRRYIHGGEIYIKEIYIVDVLNRLLDGLTIK